MLTAFPSPPIQDEITLPGDKSISHRAVLLASLAQGDSHIYNFLPSLDCLFTVRAMSLLGVTIRSIQATELMVQGVGLSGFKAPNQPIECGNAGTLMRILAGILAGFSFESILRGDASLSKRPMDRIIKPLSAMGARIVSSSSGTSPLSIQGRNPLKSISYNLPVASAQVKSSLLLAGLFAKGEVSVTEPETSRDHTERMLRLFGIPVYYKDKTITIKARPLQASKIVIPGDISSAAFFIVVATLIPKSHLIIKQVGLNPTRMGVIKILCAMGADIRVTEKPGFEPYGDIEIRASRLHGIEIPQSSVVSALDEFPILFIAAAFAQGETILKNAAELRVKESDRLQTMYEGLQACGIQVRLQNDGIRIQGGGFKGGIVHSQGDHRVAMAFACAGWVSDYPVTLKDFECIQTSFPNFENFAQRLNLKLIIQKESKL